MTGNNVPWVNDLRAEGDPSFAIVPPIKGWDDLQYWFGVDVDRSKGWDAVDPGKLCYKLVGFYVRTGASAFIPKVLDTTGNALSGVRVAHSWPGAPIAENGEQLVPDYAQETNHGVAGWTNAQGDVGFGYGHGMMMPVHGTGVGRIWPMIPLNGAEPQLSDAAMDLGWIVNTDHLTANPVFQLVQAPDEEPEPQPGEVVGYMVIVIEGKEVGRVEIIAPAQPVNGNYVYFEIGGNVLGIVDF